MGVINEPRYDEDLVTKSYLDQTIENTTYTIDGELSKLDSSVSRRAQNFGSEPTPPYYVNDTYMDGTDIYICTTERLIGDFNAADWGKASDYTDDTLASSMNKVFVNTPTPPYKIGDLWTTGPNGVLYRCKTSKILGESYNIADWENATSYDDTKTTVQNGLVTTGTVQVVQGGTVAAGVTGQTSGDTAIRFWAGSSFDNRESAPFRVTQGGAVTATSGSISGNLIASGINANNITAGTLSTSILNSDVITTTNFSAQNISADKITAGTLATARLNSDVITTTNFSAQNIDADNIKAGTLKGRAISGGSININDVFKVTSGGRTEMTTSYGFLTTGTVADHPYVSALNVSSAYNNSATVNDRGISFRNGGYINDAGEQIGFINTSTNGNGMYIINRVGTMNIRSETATAIRADTYMRITAGTSTTEGSASGNLYLAASGSVYASNAAASYSYSRVRTVSGDYSSKNIKKNIKKFKNRDYEKSIDLLKKLNIYDYEYKYKGLYDRQKQYGFIIDEIEKIDNKFFDIKEEKARIKNKSIDFGDPHAKGKKITVKNYNPDVLDKYLLTVCKAQQMKIDELEKRLEKLEGGK